MSSADIQQEGRVDAFCLPVCLICDRVIFGCETVHKVDKEAVMATKSKFSIEEYNSFYDMELHAEVALHVTSSRASCQYYLSPDTKHAANNPKTDACAPSDTAG
eukprot:scaffold6380_cov127-Skeletonema_marinoi.AAC.1